MGDLVRELAAVGATPAEAECIAGAIEDRFGGPLVIHDETGREQTEVLVLLISECQGYPLSSDTASCFTGALFELAGRGDLGLSEPVALEAGFDADDHIALSEAGLRCAGASDEVARCVTDRVLAEFGREVFDERQPELSPDQQRQAERFVADCAAG